MGSCSGILVSERSGETLRVGVAVAMSMSIMIDERLRSLGSSARDLRNAVYGLGGGSDGARTEIDGRSKDHERMRSSASAWQPERNPVSYGLYQHVNALTHPAEHTGDLEYEVEFRTP